MKKVFIIITATVFALGLVITVQANGDLTAKPAAKMEISPQPVKLELSPRPVKVELSTQPVKVEPSSLPVKLELSPQPVKVEISPQQVKPGPDGTTTEKRPKNGKEPAIKNIKDDVYKIMVTVFVIIVGVFLGGLAFWILYLIFRGRIDLSNLISEKEGNNPSESSSQSEKDKSPSESTSQSKEGGSASMSRFQWLIFTFVISSSLFIVTVYKLDFPDINNNILWLLGISSGSYVGAKAIQSFKDTIVAKFGSPPPPSSAAPEGNKKERKGLKIKSL